MQHRHATPRLTRVTVPPMQPRSLVAGRDLTSEGSGAFACLVKHGKDTFVAVWAYPPCHVFVFVRNQKLVGCL